MTRSHEGNDDCTSTIVYFHGGGFVLGDLDSHSVEAARLAQATGARVVSVEYALAPEHPFPAAVDDAIQAARWFVNAEKAGPVFLAGDSAGATLSIVAALALRTESRRLDGLIAFYPVLNMTEIGASPSYRSFGDGGAGLSEADMRWFANQYLAGQAAVDWRCSPALAPDFTNLPPVLLIAAAHDVLASESEAFEQALRLANIDCERIELQDANHGFLGAEQVIPSAELVLRYLEEWVGKRL